MLFSYQRSAPEFAPQLVPQTCALCNYPEELEKTAPSEGFRQLLHQTRLGAQAVQRQAANLFTFSLDILLNTYQVIAWQTRT